MNYDNESIKSHPLVWPPGWKRDRFPDSARFRQNHTVYSTSKKLNNELDLLGATHVILSTNLILNRDGTPRSSQRQPADPGVCVYFTLKKKEQCIPCDRWDKVEHNIHAIMLCVGALRGLDRWGAGEFVTAAFTGFKAIPEQAGISFETILELDGDNSLECAEFQYRKLAHRYHPDKPQGSEKKMRELNGAIAQAREHFK